MRTEIPVSSGLDFSAHYTVADMPGVAWYIVRFVEYEGAGVCDGHPDAPYGDGYHMGAMGEDFYCDGSCNPEPEVDDAKVIAVMVGDDREHEVWVEDLTELPEDGYCPGCGQTGCGHYR